MKEKEKKLVGSASKVSIHLPHLYDHCECPLWVKKKIVLRKNG